MMNKLRCSTLLTILLLSVSFSLLSQSDTCYTSDQNKAIADKLLEGKKCENNLTQMRLSYGDCMDQLTAQGTEISKVNNENADLKTQLLVKDLQIDRLEVKVRNRNKAIIVLVIVEAATVLFSIL